MTVGQVLDSMDSQELTEWWGYFQIRSRQMTGEEPEPPSPAQVAQKIQGVFSVFGKKGG